MYNFIEMVITSRMNLVPFQLNLVSKIELYSSKFG